MQKILKQVLIGAGLVAGLTTAAQAQYLTDAGSPLGGGGGASGSVANYMSNLGAASGALGVFYRGSSVANPMGGGAIAVNGAAREGFIQALRGNPAPLTAALGGGPAAQALAQAIGATQDNWSSITPTVALAIVDAYNAVVDSPNASVDALATVRAGVSALLLLRQ